MFLALLPAIFSLFQGTLGSMMSGNHTGIISTLMTVLMGSSPTGQGIIGAIEGIVGKIDDAKRQELINQLDSMLANVEVDKIDAQSPRWYQSCWRPTLAWGLTAIVLIHLSIAEIYNIIALINGDTLAPMDNMTIYLLGGLLGLYMTARTVEKVNSNQEEN